MRERMAPSSRRGGLSRSTSMTVDSVANADPVLERLDVDVGGPQLDRLGDHQLDQPHDRGTALVDRRRQSPAPRLRSR